MFEFNEEWLRPGAMIQLSPEVLHACLQEIQRLRAIGERGSITLEPDADGVWAAPTDH